MVTLTALRSVGSALVDIHGQHDNQALLDPARPLDFLDGYAYNELAPLKEAVAEAYLRWKEVSEAVKAGADSEAELARLEDMLRFQLDEIDSVSPISGRKKR